MEKTTTTMQDHPLLGMAPLLAKVEAENLPSQLSVARLYLS